MSYKLSSDIDVSNTYILLICHLVISTLIILWWRVYICFSIYVFIVYSTVYNDIARHICYHMYSIYTTYVHCTYVVYIVHGTMYNVYLCTTEKIFHISYGITLLFFHTHSYTSMDVIYITRVINIKCPYIVEKSYPLLSWNTYLKINNSVSPLVFFM